MPGKEPWRIQQFLTTKVRNEDEMQSDQGWLQSGRRDRINKGYKGGIYLGTCPKMQI